MMNPQVLISAVEHGAKGMIVIFDNRRMAAISSLQQAQYGVDFRTNDGVAVDYVAARRAAFPACKALSGGDTLDSLRAALKEAHAHDGLSVVHVPVYAGTGARRRSGRLRLVERRQLVRRRAAALLEFRHLIIWEQAIMKREDFGLYKDYGLYIDGQLAAAPATARFAR